MEKKNGTKKGIRTAAVCMFLALLLGILCLRYIGIPPCTRRWFPDYASFCRGINGWSNYHYPDKLPASAEGVSYIRYTGKLDKKTGISFTASDGDYSELKASLVASCFEKMSVRNAYRRYNDAVYVFDGKVTSSFLEKEELGYLEQIFRDPAENYTILAFRGDNVGGQRCIVEGVFCNDETNEIVIFGFMDAFREGRE